MLHIGHGNSNDIGRPDFHQSLTKIRTARVFSPVYACFSPFTLASQRSSQSSVIGSIGFPLLPCAFAPRFPPSFSIPLVWITLLYFGRLPHHCMAPRQTRSLTNLRIYCLEARLPGADDFCENTKINVGLHQGSWYICNLTVSVYPELCVGLLPFCHVSVVRLYLPHKLHSRLGLGFCAWHDRRGMS